MTTSDAVLDAPAAPPQPALVCGYSVDSMGNMAVIADHAIDDALAAEDTLVWLHFDQSDAAARAWIEACPRLPEGAKDILLGSDVHMRLETAGDGLIGVVGDLHHEFAERSDHLDVLRLYLDNRCLISARRSPETAVDKLRRSLGEGLRVERPLTLVTQFLHHVTDTLGDLMLDLSDRLQALEDRMLDGGGGGGADRASEELGRVRRIAARLRRHMVPQQHALLGLISRLPEWVQGPDAKRLQNAIERLGALGHDLDLVQERCRLLQDQASAKLMESTNRNLYLLSIVTALALPPTLLSGIFGMNLGGLPGGQNPFGFWYGIGFMVLTVLATVLVLRKLRIL
ncbi:CorA family divalent cation transporter [Novosphingobium rosa]|uniref:CorA family divalent cation transporter n=1 Tax=Novosphingobium rosa TaxID=76978 RepID=UPI00147204D8|nr:CorA family divalent cation transporter [Novosphingobium rosa]